MKIAQIAPLIESVPPRFYGGTERVVSYLTEELVRLGHDVTLFASGDSVTSARLVSCTTTLKIAAKVDRTDEVYFREQIAPLLKGPGVQFIGEIDEQQKSDFLGQALALMFLIDWPEPFGLSMIEAMACGTPVLALRRGSVEEVVDDGLTGQIIDSIEEATVALPRVMALDRRAVRRRFEERFTAARMANDYVRVYKALVTRANVKLVPNQAEPLHETAAAPVNERRIQLSNA